MNKQLQLPMTRRKGSVAARARAMSYLTIRCEPDLKVALEHLADNDKRTLSNYVGLVLEHHVDKASKKTRRLA